MTTMTQTSGSVSRGFAGFLEPVYRPVADLVARARRYDEYALAEARLNALSDRDLEDIGLTRIEIHDRVWRDFDRQ